MVNWERTTEAGGVRWLDFASVSLEADPQNGPLYSPSNTSHHPAQEGPSESQSTPNIGEEGQNRQFNGVGSTQAGCFF
jgi:hypothetical protein